MNKKATSLFILFLLCFAYLPISTAEQADYPEYAVIDGVLYTIGDEIPSMRKDTSKTFFAGYTEDGKVQYTSDIYQSEIHYDHNGELLDIDPTLRTRQDGTIYNDTNLFDIKADESGITIQIHGRPETAMRYDPKEVYYLENGTKRTIATFTPTVPSIVDGNRIAWQGAYGAGIEVYYEVFRTGIRLWIEVASEDVLGTVRNVPNASLNVACDFAPADGYERSENERGEDLMSLDGDTVFRILLPFVMLGEEDLRFGYHVYEQGQIVKRIPLDTFWNEREFPLMLDTSTTISYGNMSIYSGYVDGEGKSTEAEALSSLEASEDYTYSSTIIVGRQLASTLSNYVATKFRHVFTVDLSDFPLTDVTATSFNYKATLDRADTAFNMLIREGTETNNQRNFSTFNSYGSTTFASLPSSSYSTSSMVWTFNSSGVDYINSVVGGTAKLVMLSDRDIDGSSFPNRYEYIRFAAYGNASLSITYTMTTCDSLTFTNPSSSNIATADNTTAWNFSVVFTEVILPEYVDFVIKEYVEGQAGDERVFGWGDNDYGELGVGTTSTTQYPTITKANFEFDSISLQNTFSAGISDGKLYTWGNNEYGQLVQGDTTNRPIPTQVGTATDWEQVSCGANSIYVINSSGELWVGGYNGSGRLGLGDTTQRDSLTQVGTATDWEMVFGGYQQAFAIRNGGELWAWGENGYYQLGLGDTTDRTSPTQVGTATNWVEVASGYMHTMARNSSGELYGWGYNASGALGVGDKTNRTTPTKAGTATNWAQVVVSKHATAGQECSIAITSGGAMYSCGEGVTGMLGHGSTTDYTSMTQIGTATNWAQVAIGWGTVYAITTNGELYSWGAGTDYALGNGVITQEYSPIKIGTDTNWLFVQAGNKTGIAIREIPKDTLLLRWTSDTDSFSEQVDYFSAITVTSTSTDTSKSGSEWTINFKIKISGSWGIEDEDMDIIIRLIDDSGGVIETIFSNKLQVDIPPNTAPTVDSCTFTNPYTSNQAIADNATEWNFRVLVSDTDGLTDITYVELRLANATDSTTPFDSLSLRWTQSTDTFSEQADTQTAVTLTSTGSDSSSSGTQWTLDFKVQFNSNFTTKATSYSAEVYVIDSASATDLETYSSFYQVIAVSLSVNVTTDNTISWGTITTNTWTAVESETIENNGNVTEDIKIKFSTFSDGSNSWTLGSTQYDNGADKIVVMWSIDNSTWYVYTTYDSWVTIVEDKAVSSSVTLYVKMYAPTSTSSYQAHSSTLTVGCAQAS